MKQPSNITKIVNGLTRSGYKVTVELADTVTDSRLVTDRYGDLVWDDKNEAYKRETVIRRYYKIEADYIVGGNGLLDEHAYAGVVTIKRGGRSESSGRMYYAFTFGSLSERREHKRIGDFLLWADIVAAQQYPNIALEGQTA